MNAPRVAIVLTVGCLGCVAARTPILTGGRLASTTVADSVPTGWQLDGSAASMRFDSSAIARRDGRPTLRIAYEPGAPYAGIIQRVDAASLAGRPVELRARLMRDSSSASTGIWMMAVSTNRERLAYINSYDSVSAAPYRWASHHLRMTLPPTTTRLLVGASIHTERGVVWISDLSLAQGGR
jgi:hypothetical protein